MFQGPHDLLPGMDAAGEILLGASAAIAAVTWAVRQIKLMQREATGERGGDRRAEGRDFGRLLTLVEDQQRLQRELAEHMEDRHDSMVAILTTLSTGNAGIGAALAQLAKGNEVQVGLLNTILAQMRSAREWSGRARRTPGHDRRQGDR